MSRVNKLYNMTNVQARAAINGSFLSLSYKKAKSNLLYVLKQNNPFC